jgi:exodeoxyribonuclease VIII
MKIEDYHNHKALGSSGIKTLLKNPYEFLNPIKRDNANLDLGSAIHKMILEKDTFYEEFIVLPKLDRRKKTDKEAYDKFLEKKGDRKVLQEDDFNLVINITNSLLSQQTIVKSFLNGGTAEESFFSKINKIDVKCRPDYYIQDKGVVVDIKTCQDSSKDKFTKDIINYGYHIQASFYLDVLKSLNKKADHFIFIALQKIEPYMVGVYILSKKDIILGRELYEKGLQIYKELDKYQKPIYLSEEKKIIQEIELPAYAYKGL